MVVLVFVRPPGPWKGPGQGLELQALVATSSTKPHFVRASVQLRFTFSFAVWLTQNCWGCLLSLQHWRFCLGIHPKCSHELMIFCMNWFFMIFCMIFCMNWWFFMIFHDFLHELMHNSAEAAWVRNAGSLRLATAVVARIPHNSPVKLPLVQPTHPSNP